MTFHRKHKTTSPSAPINAMTLLDLDDTNLLRHNHQHLFCDKGAASCQQPPKNSKTSCQHKASKEEDLSRRRQGRKMLVKSSCIQEVILLGEKTGELSMLGISCTGCSRILDPNGYTKKQDNKRDHANRSARLLLRICRYVPAYMSFEVGSWAMLAKKGSAVKAPVRSLIFVNVVPVRGWSCSTRYEFQRETMVVFPSNTFDCSYTCASETTLQCISSERHYWAILKGVGANSCIITFLNPPLLALYSKNFARIT